MSPTLAHLELTEDERARMLKDLNSILGYIDRLNELDTSNVEPMAQVASRFDEGGPSGPTDSPTPCGRRTASLPAPRGSVAQCARVGRSVLQSAESDSSTS